MGIDTVTLSWGEMDALHRKVARMISVSGFRPEVVVGIARCGLVSAVHLAYILSIDSVEAIHVRTTPTDEVLAEKNCEPVVEWYVPESTIKGRSVLLVDSVMASGTSVQIALRTIGWQKPVDLRTAAIVDWPNSPYKPKGFPRPEVQFTGQAVDKWPVFPWEQ